MESRTPKSYHDILNKRVEEELKFYHCHQLLRPLFLLELGSFFVYT